jgi:hypothetical protein
MPKKPQIPEAWKEIAEEEGIDAEELEEIEPETMVEEEKPYVSLSVTGNDEEKKKEELLMEEIAELEEKAKARQQRAEQKARVRQLKKTIRKAKVKEAVAPVGEAVEPLVTVGKKAVQITKETARGLQKMGQVMASKKQVGTSTQTGKQKMQMSFGQNVSTSVSGGKRGLQLGLGAKKEGAMGSVLGKGQQYDFSLGKRGGQFDLTAGRRNKMDVSTVLSHKTDYDFSRKKKKGGT